MFQQQAPENSSRRKTYSTAKNVPQSDCSNEDGNTAMINEVCFEHDTLSLTTQISNPIADLEGKDNTNED